MSDTVDTEARRRIEAHDEDLDDLSARQDETDASVQRLADLLAKVDRKLDALLKHNEVPFRE